jgi:hypothetical protein
VNYSRRLSGGGTARAFLDTSWHDIIWQPGIATLHHL